MPTESRSTWSSAWLSHVDGSSHWVVQEHFSRSLGSAVEPGLKDPSTLTPDGGMSPGVPSILPNSHPQGRYFSYCVSYISNANILLYCFSLLKFPVCYLTKAIFLLAWNFPFKSLCKFKMATFYVYGDFRCLSLNFYSVNLYIEHLQVIPVSWCFSFLCITLFSSIE